MRRSPAIECDVALAERQVRHTRRAGIAACDVARRGAAAQPTASVDSSASQPRTRTWSCRPSDRPSSACRRDPSSALAVRPRDRPRAVRSAGRRPRRAPRGRALAGDRVLEHRLNRPRDRGGVARCSLRPASASSRRYSSSLRLRAPSRASMWRSMRTASGQSSARSGRIASTSSSRPPGGIAAWHVARIRTACSSSQSWITRDSRYASAPRGSAVVDLAAGQQWALQVGQPRAGRTAAGWSENHPSAAPPVPRKPPSRSCDGRRFPPQRARDHGLRTPFA
jgi:hypothetical protein